MISPNELKEERSLNRLPVNLYGEILEAGAMIDRWMVERLIHRGASAQIYRAVDLHDRSHVAIKVLDTALLNAPQALARFSLEADALVRLNHSSIARLFDTGALPDGRPYLVMEWLEGKDLSTISSERGAIPLEEVLQILEPLVDALDAAHRMGIIHRDVKAENVKGRFAAPNTPFVLIDFGIAKRQRTSAMSVMTTAGAVMGTPICCAPEQIRNEAIDERVDVYGLGVLKGKIRYPHDFDAPLPGEVLALFEGRRRK